MSELTDHRFAPLPLWRAAGALLQTLFTLFGAPEQLAERHTIVGAEHKLILNWLRCAEALMRRLLFIEASAYPKPNTRPLLHATRARKRRTMEFWPDKPEEWRVSFRVFMDRPRPAGMRRRQPATTPAVQTRFHSAWPLAERFEALLRAHNDPAPFARRLARRLYARPHAIDTLLRAPAELEHRIALDDHAALCTLIEERKTRVIDTS